MRQGEDTDLKPNFFFGAATASHQVEGGNKNNWIEWEKKNAKRLAKNAQEHPWLTWDEKILRGFPSPLAEENYISGRACDHYNRFREDFDIAKSLGHTAHRFSLEWSRIEPEEGKFDEKELTHYRGVITALRENGIEPFVTIWHWTLPLWLSEKGGVLAKDFPKYFARYAEAAAKAMPDVRFWITINEPEVVTFNSYLRGVWPPQRKNIFLYYRATNKLIAAHRAAYRKLKTLDGSFQIGAAMNFKWFESAGGIVNNFLAWFANRETNFRFPDRICRESDFVGANYYFHNRIDYGFNKNKNERISDMGWELCPEGIFHALEDLKNIACRFTSRRTVWQTRKTRSVNGSSRNT